MASIYSITYTPKGSSRQSPDAYVRVSAQNAQLVTGHGIDGDRKGGSPKRQLNVMSRETLKALEGEGFTVQPGAMGEQLVLEGVDVSSLQPGDRVQLGENAVIEVISHRTGCDRFEHIQGHPRTEVQGRLGVMAAVVESGAIAVGDAVSQVESAVIAK